MSAHSLCLICVSYFCPTHELKVFITPTTSLNWLRDYSNSSKILLNQFRGVRRFAFEKIPVILSDLRLHYIRDMLHVYLNRFEFHFLRLHINKTNFAFSCITEVSLILPNRQNGNLKLSHNTVALNTFPPPFN